MIIPANQLTGANKNKRNKTKALYTGWLKINYPTGEYAISLQPVVWFLQLLNPDTSLNLTVFNVSTAPWLYNHTTGNPLTVDPVKALHFATLV